MSSGAPAGAAHSAPAAGGAVKNEGTNLRGWILLFVVLGFCGWFYWPRIQAKVSEWRASSPPSTSEKSEESSAPPSGSAEAKSGSDIPDMPRAISNALAAIPVTLFGSAEKKGPPRPPGTVYEMWVRPGVAVWTGTISRSRPSPWFEAKETVFAFIDTDDEGVQRKEFFPGNPHIFRWVEFESDEPLPAAAFGEELP